LATIWPIAQALDDDDGNSDDTEFGTVDGVRIDKGNRSTPGNLLQCYFDHYKSHVTRPEIEPGPPR
jgi:hypothetical protein